ncbi:hypothetical protein D3C84_1196410 [compost metagenome]
MQIGVGVAQPAMEDDQHALDRRRGWTHADDHGAALELQSPLSDHAHALFVRLGKSAAQQ